MQQHGPYGWRPPALGKTVFTNTETTIIEYGGPAASAIFVPIWRSRFDATFTTVQIGQYSTGVFKLYAMFADNTIRVLNSDGTLFWAKKQTGGPGSLDFAYGYVALHDVDGDGYAEVMTPSHDGMIRCWDHDGSVLLWSVKNAWDRHLQTPVWEWQRIFMHAGTIGMVNIAGTPTACLFNVGFDGWCICIRVSDGTVLWEANLNWYGTGGALQDGLDLENDDDHVIYLNRSDFIPPLSPDWNYFGQEPAPVVKIPRGESQLYAFCTMGACIYKFNAAGGPTVKTYKPDWGEKGVTPLWPIDGKDRIPVAPCIAVADIDNDGNDEVIIIMGHWYTANEDRSYIMVFDSATLGAATDNYKYKTQISVREWYWTDGLIVSMNSDNVPCVYDLDRDGKPRIYFGSDQGYVFCYKVVGGVLTELWRRMVTHPVYQRVNDVINSAIAAIDVDGDGIREIIVSLYTGFFLVLDADNGRMIDLVRIDPPCGIEGTVTAGDIDGDGKMEIIVPALEHGEIRCYKGGIATAASWMPNLGGNKTRDGQVVDGAPPVGGM